MKIKLKMLNTMDLNSRVLIRHHVVLQPDKDQNERNTNLKK